MATTRIKVHQLTDGVDGELITWDASGHPTTVATGTAGHVLTSNGLGAAPTFQAVVDATTASNGLIKTGNDIALGGSLTANTTITTTSGFTLNVATSRAGASNAGFIVTNNSTGTALKGVASGTGTGYGVWGTSADNYGVRGENASGIAAGAFFTIDNTNNVINGLIVDRQKTTSAGNGIGVSLDFNVESTTTISQQANTLVSKFTDATHVSRTSEFSITGVNNAVAATLFTLAGTGQVKFNKYGINTFTGTAAYALHVDASGNIIEGSLSGGTPTTIEVTNDNLSGGAVYPVWTSGASSSQALKISTTKISFVPSTGQLTATEFIGDLTGNASGTSANVTGTVAIANGGTGQTTAANAINALVPTQTGNSGKYLTTNGTVVSWATVAGGGLSDADYGDITVTGSGTVMTIDNLAVTNAKINDVSVAKLTSGTIPATITLNAGGTTRFETTYAAGDVGISMSSNTNKAFIKSQDGEQSVEVNNTSVDIRSGTTGLLTFIDEVLRIYETDQTNFIGIKAPTLSADYTLTLPTTAGAANQVLTTNGSGTLSWANVGNVNYAAKTANYTVTATDDVIDCTANSFTVSLPTAVGITGKKYSVKNSAAGQNIIVDPSGAETIDGGATYTILFRESITVCSTGANWIII